MGLVRDRGSEGRTWGEVGCREAPASINVLIDAGYHNGGVIGGLAKGKSGKL